MIHVYISIVAHIVCDRLTVVLDSLGTHTAYFLERSSGRTAASLLCFWFTATNCIGEYVITIHVFLMVFFCKDIQKYQ